MNVGELRLTLKLRDFENLTPKLAVRFLYDPDEFYRLEELKLWDTYAGEKKQEITS